MLAGVVLLTACYKDKGNYNYTQVNKITVTDAKAASRMFLFQGDMLQLNPAVQQSIPSDDLSYLWFVYNNSTNSDYTLPRDTIARTLNLNHKITGDIFVLGENYRLTLKVTDNKTGISSFVLYDITISNKYGMGWLLFEEKGNGNDLSIVLPDNTAEYNIYSMLNPSAPLAGKPVSITASSFSVTDDLSTPNKRIYLQTENDAIELNNLTLTKKFDIGYLFFARPSIVKPTYIGWTAYISGTAPYQRMGVAINNGQMHTNLVGGFPGAKKWGNALPNPNGVYDYDIAPYFAGATTSSPTYPIVVYDKKYKRFYTVGANALTAFPAAASNHFDMNNVGMDLLMLDSSNVANQYNAVVKDATTPYLLQFKTITTTADPVATVGKTAMNAPGIMNTKYIAASTLTPHIFYATGNKVYKYEVTSNTNAEAFSFPANESVTAIDYQKAIPGTTQQRLVVATWNGSQGKLYYFNISAVGALGDNYTNVFSGFNKIVDLAYKY